MAVQCQVQGRLAAGAETVQIARWRPICISAQVQGRHANAKTQRGISLLKLHAATFVMHFN